MKFTVYNSHEEIERANSESPVPLWFVRTDHTNKIYRRIHGIRKHNACIDWLANFDLSSFPVHVDREPYIRKTRPAVLIKRLEGRRHYSRLWIRHKIRLVHFGPSFLLLSTLSTKIFATFFFSHMGGGVGKWRIHRDDFDGDTERMNGTLELCKTKQNVTISLFMDDEGRED